jgi:hypothetical protein
MIAWEQIFQTQQKLKNKIDELTGRTISSHDKPIRATYQPQDSTEYQHSIPLESINNTVIESSVGPQSRLLSFFECTITNELYSSKSAVKSSTPWREWKRQTEEERMKKKYVTLPL